MATVASFHVLLGLGWAILAVVSTVVRIRNKQIFPKLIISTKQIPIEHFIKYQLSKKLNAEFARQLERQYQTFVANRVEKYGSENNLPSEYQPNLVEVGSPT
jgi:hypothetical protein